MNPLQLAKRPNFSVVLLAAGDGTRAKTIGNKVLYRFFDKSILEYSLDVFLKFDELDNLYLVIRPKDEEEMIMIQNRYQDERIKLVYGGASRSESVRNGLKENASEYVLIHDAARYKITVEDVDMVLEGLKEYGAVTLYHDVIDTVKLCEEKVTTLERKNLKAVTTPQGFKKEAQEIILNSTGEYYDDLQILEEHQNITLGFLLETHDNPKFTLPKDIPTYRVGHSLDFHPLKENRKLILGGILFDYPLGLDGHSDADVVYHAVTEALMGAMGYGDLGTLFPDSDERYRNIDSGYFLLHIKELMLKNRYELVNMDIMIYLEEPKLKDYKSKMEENIAKILCTTPGIINVKATTMEKKGIIGTKEGIAAEAYVLIRKGYY